MTTTIFRSGPAWALVVLLALFAGGCDKHKEDKKFIHATWKQYVDGREGNDPTAVTQALSKGTLDHYTRIVKLALDAPAKEALALKPNEMTDLLSIRARMTRAEVKGMDGKAFVAHAVKNGWWQGSIDDTWRLKDVKVNGDAATAVMHNPTIEKELQRARTLGGSPGWGGRRRWGSGLTGNDEKAPQYPVRMVKESGFWKLDETSMFGEYDKMLEQEAKDARKSMRDYLMLREEYSGEGGDVPMSIWEPMKDTKKKKP